MVILEDHPLIESAQEGLGGRESGSGNGLQYREFMAVADAVSPPLTLMNPVH